MGTPFIKYGKQINVKKEIYNLPTGLKKCRF